MQFPFIWGWCGSQVIFDTLAPWVQFPFIWGWCGSDPRRARAFQAVQFPFIWGWCGSGHNFGFVHRMVQFPFIWGWCGSDQMQVIDSSMISPISAGKKYHKCISGLTVELLISEKLVDHLGVRLAVHAFCH